ncbi:hypothetical protein GGI26_006198 [Coemansia sp. RSA 1358]|uniref:Uncharacterized protein n=1 Tax=Coemansia umbellata TaxID=1424467 RepID=A0ABQ8PDV3_9FUNG|nr:hypothetical protein EDC05_006054 [Coemansia umbellata]KAJ2618983.1 hypothetical protein GGI26_006198 [Coemansia sp. RSA 1358]
MRFTFIAQAKAQYQWHRHVPLMKFVGPRKNVWKPQRQQQQQQESSANSEAINFWELPSRYRPLPVTEAEIEAIESGGATFH